MVNTNLDTTPLPPNKLAAQDPQSAELAGYVRTKRFGRDVRESIARSIELNSTRSKSAEILANKTVNVAKDLTNRFNRQIGALTEDSEVIDARGGKATLGKRLNDTDEQLAQMITVDKISKQPVNHNCIGSIIWDDGWTYDYTEVYPLMQELGVVANTAVVTEPVINGNSYYMTPKQIKELHDNGWGVLTHTVNHPDLTTLGEGSLDMQMRESKLYLESLIDAPVDYIVYPKNRYNVSVLKKAQEHFKGGFARYMPLDDSVDSINILPLNQYAIYRIALEQNLEKLKPLIDRCVAEKGYLVFMGHGKSFSSKFNTSDNIILARKHVSEVINYCLSVGVNFMNVDDAMEIVGNIATVGDERTGVPYYFIGKNNAIRTSDGGTLKGQGISINTLPSSFPPNRVSVFEMRTADKSGFPENGGTLIVSRPSRNFASDEITYQIWKPHNSSNLYIRNWIHQNKNWGTFKQFEPVNSIDVTVTIPQIQAKGTYFFDVPAVGIRPATHTFIQAYLSRAAYNTDSSYRGYCVANDNIRIFIRNLTDAPIVGGNIKVSVKWQ